MAKLYNLARMTTATTGTGTITLGAAVSGFLTFAQGGVQNGETVVYGIKDGTNSEIGTGVYTASGTTLTRSVRKSTNANAAINLSGSAEVFITVGAEDILVPANNLSDVASVTTTRQNLSIQPPQCGLLQVNSTTQIAFVPKNGDKVQIAGTVFSIPSGGVTAANTGVFVNGTSGQNLAASTAYLVCVFNNSGTLALDFITTLTHAADTTAGNVGVEIKSGDNSRTVVGMILTNGSSQFQDNTGFRGCASWFNGMFKAFSLGSLSNVTTSSTTPAVVSSSTMSVITLSGRSTFAEYNGDIDQSGSSSVIDVSVDNGSVIFGGQPTSFSNTANLPVRVGGWAILSEGAHVIGGRAWNGGGGSTLHIFNSFMSGLVWG